MIKIGGNENDTFRLWKKWHSRHSIDSDPKLSSSIQPKNNKISKTPYNKIKYVIRPFTSLNEYNKIKKYYHVPL